MARWIASALVLGLLAAPLHAEEPKLTEQEAALFAWWDALEYPDVGSLPFVKVAEANWARYDEDPAFAIYDHAFLLADEGTTFRVFTTDLRTKTLTKTPEGVEEIKRIGYERIELLPFVRNGIDEIAANPNEAAWHGDVDPFGSHRWAVPDHSFRMLVLARACAAHKRVDLAHELVELAVTRRLRYAEKPKEAAELDVLKRDIADEAYRTVVEAVGEESVSNTDLAHRLVRFAKRFPKHVGAAKAKSDALRFGLGPVVPGMVDPEKPDHLEGPLREAMWRVGTRWGSWGPAASRFEEGSPERKIYELGFQVVPRLIPLLKDARPTRQLDYWSTMKGQYRDGLTIRRVRDLAYDLLRALSVEAIAPQDGTWENSTDDKVWPKRLERASAWWAAIQERGEIPVLVERVERADDNAIPAAQRLIKLSAADALPALGRAIQKTKAPWISATLIKLMADIGTPEAIDNVLQILATDKRPRARLGAARALLKRGRDEGIPAMLAEWRSPSPQPIQADAGLPADPGFQRDLITFLAGSGDARAYKVLAEDLESTHAHWRWTVLAHFLSDHELAEATLAPAAQAALEDLIGARLGDTEDNPGMHWHLNGTRVDTRVGHIAARALATLLPDRYAYDPALTPRGREAMRRACEDTWRAHKGLPALPPVTDPRKVPRLAPGVVAAALEALTNAESDDARDTAIDPLVALGPGALPGVLAAIDKLAGDAPERAWLIRASRRMAAVVTAIELTKDSAHPPAPMLALFEEIRGKQFTSATYLKLMLHVTQRKSEGLHGIRVRLSRHEDLRGVQLDVTLYSTPRSDGLNRGGWSRRTPRGGHGSMALDYGRTEKAWTEDARHIDVALRAPPARPIIQSFSVMRLPD